MIYRLKVFRSGHKEFNNCKIRYLIPHIVESLESRDKLRVMPARHQFCLETSRPDARYFGFIAHIECFNYPKASPMVKENISVSLRDFLIFYMIFFSSCFSFSVK